LISGTKSLKMQRKWWELFQLQRKGYFNVIKRLL
jgi:hypothetical protein